MKELTTEQRETWGSVEKEYIKANEWAESIGVDVLETSDIDTDGTDDYVRLLDVYQAHTQQQAAEEEALIEALRQHDDGLIMASDRDWIRGMVLITFRHLMKEQQAEEEWEDGEPIHPGDYWLWADFNSFEGDQDGKDLTIGRWNGDKWVTRSDGILMDWIKVIKWKPYEEIWPSPPTKTQQQAEEEE